MSPLISVLIPCYNHEAFLDDCLGSIVDQTYANIELLICDDCSPDGSYAKILSWEETLRNRFSRVEILRNDVNCGVTKNINRMLNLAQGEYIKILASDDAVAPSALECMVEYLVAHPEIHVAVANGVKVSESERYPDFTPIEAIYSEAPDFSPDGFCERVAACNPISAPAAMVRKTVYEQYGFYDEQVKVEDYEFWLRILKDGNVRFGFLDKKLLFYRLNGNSMTSLTGNEGLARRRKLIHSSELGTLAKYREALSAVSYAEIVTDRFLSEYWLAVEYRLKDWKKELDGAWRTFSEKKDLPWKRRIAVGAFLLRQRVKSLLRRG